MVKIKDRKAVAYAISLKCTNDTATPVLDLWREASRFETAPSMQALNYPPHLTLAIYGDIAPEQPLEVVRKVFRDTPSISVEFSGIHHFPNETVVLWARPVDDSVLRRMHQAIHREIDPMLCHEHYRPSHWRSHCTIAMNIPKEAAAAALRWAAETPARFAVTFDIADYIGFPPVEILEEVKLLP
ncbi:2'-5' RNA ligase family protein [Rhizobium rhizogenes]|uniref:2'-5' RNA ligase family protein n=1 Tax=Rhizobium rhizogenes TaxID=359 RepID=UPI0015B56723|nr:2'-5' RNA ligase family protein [Rhizobium rhizogenes]